MAVRPGGAGAALELLGAGRVVPLAGRAGRVAARAGSVAGASEPCWAGTAGVTEARAASRAAAWTEGTGEARMAVRPGGAGAALELLGAGRVVPLAGRAGRVAARAGSVAGASEPCWAGTAGVTEGSEAEPPERDAEFVEPEFVWATGAWIFGTTGRRRRGLRGPCRTRGAGCVEGHSRNVPPTPAARSTGFCSLWR